MTQNPISLFDDVQILPNISQRTAIQYLEKHCTVDVLGDTIYPKKPGNDPTTHSITFESDEIILIKKIKDSDGNNTDDIVFDRTDSDDLIDDEFDSCLYCGGEITCDATDSFCSEQCKENYQSNLT